MFCFKCGKEIPSNTAFCPFCGQIQEDAASSELQKNETPKYRPGTIQIIHEGKRRRLLDAGYFIYVDDTKYYTLDFPDGIITAVTPGRHRIFATGSEITNKDVKKFGKDAAGIGRFIGGRALLVGKAIKAATKVGGKVVDKVGTCSYNINVNSGEKIKLKVVLKAGIAFPTITIEEIERS